MRGYRVGGVNKVRAKGRIYYYHRRSGKRIRALYGSPAFLLELDALNKQKPPPAPKGTLGALIVAYRGSPQFLGLAPRTRSDYQKVFDALQDIAHLSLADIDAPYILDLQDATFTVRKRRFANYLVQVIRLLFEWGKLRGHLKSNPAVEIKLIRRPKGARRVNRAWTSQELETVMGAAPPFLKLPIAIGAYIGMREGNMVELLWSAYDGSWLRFVQNKTDGPLEVPVFSVLKELLDHTKKRSVNIVTGKHGRPYTESGFRSVFFRLIRKLKAQDRIGAGLTFHGLRSTATKTLLELGCDSRTTRAITGHSNDASIEVYAKEVEQHKLARLAVAKMERNRDKVAKQTRTRLQNRKS